MTIEISYSGVTFAYPNMRLKELPFGFDGSNVKRGRSVEKLTLTGLLMREDAETLIDLYRSWRDDKIEEEDPQQTGVVGVCVLITATGLGFNWTSKECWFSKAPELKAAGIYANVSIELVDAEQALQVLMEDKEDSDEDGIEYGVITLGGAVINLTAYPNSYNDLPTLARNPAGAHIISGSLSLVEIKEVEGWVTDAHLTLLTSWLNTTVATTPSPGTWFPVNWTKPKAEIRKVGLTYNVQLQLTKIKG